MPISLEDRVREIERFRYSMLGRVNALQTLIGELYVRVFRLSPETAVNDAMGMRKNWLKASQTFLAPVHGIDSVHLDAISQEYEKAIDELTHSIVLAAANLAVRQAQATTSSQPETNHQP